ncbi:GNAT family N-acetyltransferase [Taklimakanibacter deserti]|uniref:GNAT family N-acetyltransferase n=1 Tax=Taklimakanibacter deserti TaxID=2267839 RepID=UPI0034D7ADDA
MHIIIRRASATDALALTDLMRASSTYEGEYARILDGYRVTPEQISRDLIFLAEASGRLLGFYSLMLGEEPELDLMFVADDMQGTGLGRQLFEHMRDEARQRGIPLVRIVSHPLSVGFYRRMGAELIGTKPPSPPRVTWERPVLTLRTGPA